MTLTTGLQYYVSYNRKNTDDSLTPTQRLLLGKNELEYLIKSANANDINSFRFLVKHAKAINLQDPRINTLLEVIPESMQELRMELINKQDSHGKTMLHFAVLNRDLALVKRLDQFGAAVFLTNNFGYTAFDYAVQQQNVDLFQHLMIYQRKINFHDTNIRDIFVKLACKGSKDAIEFLIDKRESLKSFKDLECHKNILQSCFLNAAIFGHPEICMLLIELDTLKEKIINSINNDGQSALHLAVIYGEFEIFKLILDSFNKDFNPLLNLKDYHGKTAVDYALDEKNLKIFNLLVQYGAHFNRHDKRLSNLIDGALDDKNLDLFNFLVQYDVHFNKYDKRLSNLLVVAVDNCDLESSKYLTNVLKEFLNLQLQKIDAQYVQNNLKSAFHKVCINGFDDLALYFLNDALIKDIIIDAINTLGQSGLHLATIYKRINIVKLLIYLDTSLNPQDNTLLNLQDNEGNTALHVAALRRNKFIYNLLEFFGADKTIENNNNETPAKLMCQHFKDNTAKILVPSRGM